MMIGDDFDLSGTEGAIYSRKSRKDLEAERAATEQGKPYDTLEKHRIELFRIAREMNLTIGQVYEELESGEFIGERPKMQKLLEEIQEGRWTWVLVMDEDRLGRGDDIDQGRIKRAFKMSDTLLITPGKIVDLNNDADELYMDFKGMGARYEYKQIKKRLHGGRKRSAARGNYVGTKSPYGYLKGIEFKTRYPQFINRYVEKAVDMENLKLYPHPEEADFVKQIFDWFLSGTFMSTIIERLNNLTPSPTGNSTWTYSCIYRMLKNHVYYGAIRFGNQKFTKLENGLYKVRKVPIEKVQITENAHIPIVSKEDFLAVQKIIEGRNHSKVNRNKELIFPMAYILKCSYCGLVLSYKKNYSKPYNQKTTVLCTNINCSGNHSIPFEYVEERTLELIDHYFKSLQSHPEYTRKNNSSDPVKPLERQRETLKRELNETNKQKNNLHDFLERGVYSVETFLERQKSIAEKLNQLNEAIVKLDEEIKGEIERNKTRSQFIPMVRHVLNAYRTAPNATEKNKLLRSIIDSIYYEKPEKGTKRNPEFYLKIKWKDI